MEIEVGEYVRLKNGLIGQFYNIEEGYDCNTQVNFEEFGYEYEDIEQFYEDIKVNSKNIIDLIEVGDYVNGHRVEQVSIETNEVLLDHNGFGWRTLKALKDGDKIATHEQFSSIEYKVDMKGERK